METVERALVEAVPTAQLIVDPGGRVVAASHALRRLLDLGDDPTGRPARFLSRRPGWQRTWKLVEQGVDSPQVVALEDGAGDHRYYELQVTASGSGTVVCLHDVTAVRAVHQQLRSASKLLAAARAQLLASREEMQRAEGQLAELVGELEALSAQQAEAEAAPQQLAEQQAS